MHRRYPTPQRGSFDPLCSWPGPFPPPLEPGGPQLRGGHRSTDAKTDGDTVMQVLTRL